MRRPHAMHIRVLPRKLLLHISSWLNDREICNMEFTCKQLYIALSRPHKPAGRRLNLEAIPRGRSLDPNYCRSIRRPDVSILLECGNTASVSVLHLLSARAAAMLTNCKCSADGYKTGLWHTATSLATSVMRTCSKGKKPPDLGPTRDALCHLSCLLCWQAVPLQLSSSSLLHQTKVGRPYQSLVSSTSFNAAH